jgi:hypothetical protein
VNPDGLTECLPSLEPKELYVSDFIGEKPKCPGFAARSLAQPSPEAVLDLQDPPSAALRSWPPLRRMQHTQDLTASRSTR